MVSQRKKYPPERKVEILREHLKNKMSVSKVCEKYGVNPNMFYKWEKQLFEGAIETFSGDHSRTMESPRIYAGGPHSPGTNRHGHRIGEDKGPG